MSTLAFYAQFTKSLVGVNSLTVTWDVEQITRSDGTRSALVTGGATSITIGRRGLYGYLLAAADTKLYDYVATAITAGDVDQKEIAALWTMYEADTIQLSGDGAAADNLELFFDGTGYASAGSINSVSGTVSAQLADGVVHGGTTAELALKSIVVNNPDLGGEAVTIAANSTTGTALLLTGWKGLDAAGGAGGDIVGDISGALDGTIAGLTSDAQDDVAAAILATPAYKIATLSGGEIVISPETVVAAYLTSASSDGKQLIADAVNNLAPASTGATGSIRAKLDAIKAITDAIDATAVTVTSTNNAGVLTFTQGVTFAATVSGLTISATWAKLYFTLKESDYDTDDLALLQLVETNPGAGTDGLLYLAGDAIASPITVADGTLTVSQAAGTVAIAITDNATAALSKASGLVWDIKTKDAAGATVQNTTGTASITRAVTQTI